MQNEEQPRITIDELARMMADGFAETRNGFAALRSEMLDGFGTLEKRVLSTERGLNGLKYKVDQLDAKLDQHRQETKDGFAAFHPIIGSLSHTVVDHEQRIKELEGE